MIKSVPMDYALKWLEASHQVSRKDYTLFLSCALLPAIVGLILGATPYIGHFIQLPFLFFVQYSAMRFLRRYVAGESLTFEQFVALIFDYQEILKNKWFVLVCALLSLPIVVLDFFNMDWISISANIICLYIAYFMSFAAFLFHFKGSASPQEAIKTSLSGFTQNLVPVLLNGLLVSLFSAICILFCFLPFFLVFLPFTFAMNYMIYISIFEGVDLNTYIAELRKTPQGKEESF